GEAPRIPLPRGAFGGSRSVSPFLPISSRTHLTGEPLPEARPAGLEGSMSVSYRLSTRRFGELVLESGHVTLDQLDAARHAKRGPRGRLGQTLVRLGYLDEGQVIELLAKQFNLPVAPPDRLSQADEAVVKLIPEHLARQAGVLALSRNGDQLDVAMGDPLDVVSIDHLRALTGCRTAV